MNIKGLIQKRADLVREQKGLFEAGRPLTEDEKQRDDAIVAEVGGLDADIARAKRQQALELAGPGVPVGAVTGERIEFAPEDKHPFKSLGEQMAAVITAKMSPHSADPRLEKYNRYMAATGMNEGSLDAGGAFVQTDYSNTLWERTYAQGSVLNRVPDQPIGADANAYSALLIKETSRATGSRYGGLRVYRVGEGATINGSRPEFDRKEIRPYKLAALAYLTDELVKDAAALEGHVRRLFPLESAFLMEDELFNGTGVGQSMGVLNAVPTISVAKETGQAAATIVYQNLLKMWARLWSGSEGSAVWYANKDTFPQLMQLFLAAGTGAIPAQGITFVNGRFTIFGAPVVFVEYAQTLGTVGDIQLVDFSQYLGVRKGEVDVQSSIHVAFVTDEMALRFIWRYAAEPLWRAPLTPAKGSNTLSPFVTLATRS